MGNFPDLKPRDNDNTTRRTTPLILLQLGGEAGDSWLFGCVIQPHSSLLLASVSHLLFFQVRCSTRVFSFISHIIAFFFFHVPSFCGLKATVTYEIRVVGSRLLIIYGEKAHALCP